MSHLWARSRPTRTRASHCVPFPIMKNLFSALALSLGTAAASLTVASPAMAAPAAGKDYTVLQAAQPVGAPAGKVEVIEFFWYGCPHCNEFEPYIEAWEKKQGPDV